MPLLKTFILFISAVVLTANCVHSQEQLYKVHNIRDIDSVIRIKHFHFAGTNSIKPIFSQRSGYSRRVARNITLPSILSASLTVCFDTSGRYFLQKDTMTYYVGSSIKSADGNILMSGEWASRNIPYPTGGFLMKCSDTGTVQWTRHYDSANHIAPSFFNYYKLIELQDGSILMAGATNNEATRNGDLVLTLTDNIGNITWSKTYKSRLWSYGSGSADYFYVQDMQQDPSSGDIFLTGPHWSDGKNITRVHLTDGNIVWSKFYQLWGGASFDHPFGFYLGPNELVSFSCFLPYYGGTYTSMFRINKNTGDTISTKYFRTIDSTGINLGVLDPQQVVILSSGNFALTGKLFRFYYSSNDSISPLCHTGVEEFDGAGNFVQAYCFKNYHESNFYNTRITLFKDGSGVFSMLKYITGYTGDVYYVQFKNGQILKQRMRHYVGEGMPNEGAALRLADGSDLIIKLLGDTITNINKIEFLNLHISDTASNCLGLEDNSAFSEPYRMEPVLYGLDSIGANDFSEGHNKSISVRSTQLDYLPACRQISYCDTLSLHIPQDTICLSNPLLLTVRKNHACGASPFFSFDTSFVKSYQKLNDSVYMFSFKSAGHGTLYGSISGCSLLQDSVKITVLHSKGKVNLGADTVICPGNTLRLNAGSGYAAYLWQDGSTDSIFNVHQPGVFNIRVIDSCGNRYADTIMVNAHPPIPFNIGPNRIKCNNDTLHLSAPAGFLNYTWGPDYNISSLIQQQVTVRPLIDTIYYARAEKSQGCFAFDTLHITVNHSPAINLGNNRSFCKGDSAVLDAGPGFVYYQWNTSSSNRQLTVFQTGSYNVTATDLNGCITRDTVQVLNVWDNPQIKLNHDSTLCVRNARILQPGNFSFYQWQDGSKLPTFTVSSTGIYYVTVSDTHQCSSSDTVHISKMLDLPAGFLPADTAVCSYGTIELKPDRNYKEYLWSTGYSGPSIIVTKPGLYWLQVKDNYQCIGSDTVLVKPKECLKGFHIPNAFTPNNDGRNDLFRPIIGGIVKQYEFTVYNRYGNLVFRTTDLNKGWDGIDHGKIQDPNVYVWICIYQLEGSLKKIERGTVVLIK